MALIKQLRLRSSEAALIYWRFILFKFSAEQPYYKTETWKLLERSHESIVSEWPHPDDVDDDSDHHGFCHHHDPDPDFAWPLHV